MDMWNDPEFKEWFDSRPEIVQKAVLHVPPDKIYRIKGTPKFPATIVSYGETEDGEVTLTVDVHSPLFPRQVFGLGQDDVELWPNQNITLEEAVSEAFAEGFV